MNKHYRQGDVLIVRVDEPVPAGAKKVKRDNGRVILAYGEVTGHAHAILDREADLFELTVDEVERRFLEITSSVDLVHEEHSTVALPPGTYEVRRQREYAPDAIRNVAD